MKCIALLSLIFLIGAAFGQQMYTGGYTNTQLTFLNGATTTPFEPFVEKYWSSYINNASSIPAGTSNPAATMNIWFNTFPFGFDKPVQVKSSSFGSGVSDASSYSPAEWNSMLIKRDTFAKFNKEIDQKSSSSLTTNDTTSLPGASSPGQVLSQGIKNMFSY
jgi:hypothetical protein